VLLAGATVALALVPMAAAYLQLGYQADLEAGTDRPSLAEVDATLARGLNAASAGVPAGYNWTDRGAAVEAVSRTLTDWLRALERAPRGRVLDTDFDNRTATRLAARDCPGGPSRAFGPCVARGGLVLQERANRTHVLAAAIEVRALGRGAGLNATLVSTVG
jgi:hypothetical protein